MYSRFFFGNADHVNGQKFHVRSGVFAKPLPSQDLDDYYIETPEEAGRDQERKRKRVENDNFTENTNVSKIAI